MKQDPAIDARLIALSAGTQAAREAARDEADKLVELVEWPLLARRLQSRRLLPLLGERIVALAGPRAPDSFVEAADAAIRECSERDRWVELISIHLTDVLRAEGIPSLPLKGPILGKALYGALGRRPSGDIDLLVAREDLPGAIEAAGRLGYGSPDQTNAEGVPLLHVRLDHAANALPPLELHWRVHWYEARFSRELLFRSVDATGPGRPAPLAHELASLLLFYARDGFVDLRLACDIATWWDVFGSDLEPAAMSAIIDGYPELERALLAAVEVANRVVGLPGPALVAERHRPERRVRLAERLANPEGHGSRQQLVADVWLVDWLLTPPGGRGDCIWRQLHAPGDIGSSLTPPALDPVASMVRAARLLPRYGVSLLRIALDPSVRPPTFAPGRVPVTDAAPARALH